MSFGEYILHLFQNNKESYLTFIISILDSIHDGIVVIDKFGIILYANPAYTRILGINTNRVIGKNMSDIAPEAIALKTLENKEAIINRLSRVLGLNKDVVVSATPIFHQNEFLGALSLFRDISEVRRLTEELNRAKEFAKYLQEELNRKDGVRAEFGELIGRNSKLLETLYQAAKVAKTDCTVFIRGESGVGKEIVATSIHNASKRKSKPLVRINCAAIPENLLESELFGYEEGAFTGARRGGKPGKFELANGGTLFLDEIGDMSIPLQAKLLRALQDKEVERLGGINPIRTDVRIIAATNQDLEAKIKERSFREDLFYRLNAFPLVIPPLKERKDDILLLADYFLHKLCQTHEKVLTFSSEVLHALHNHAWPGNVRELQNVVEHAVVVCEGQTIKIGDLPSYFHNIPNNILEIDHLLPGTAAQTDLNLPRLVARIEKKIIRDALLKSGENKTEAIKNLGISRAAFYSKLKKYFPDKTFREG